MEQPTDFEVRTDDGVRISGESKGEGPAIVLLHGLSATRRYVVMGSRLLERSGMRAIAYDARGHGRSTPAPAHDAYGYERLAVDLRCVLDHLGIERAALAGASMGAHTSIRFALDHPHRVSALGIITPAYEPELQRREDREGALARWDALAQGLRSGGVEGFLGAYDISRAPEKWRETIVQVIRQRLAGHEHPEAVADALETVPRSQPFGTLDDLREIAAPTLVIASRDEADPGHPLQVGQRYAETIPGARLLVEQPGSSPLAWQGGQLSRALLELVNGAAGRA